MAEPTRAGIEGVAELLMDRFGAEAELRAEIVAFALHEIGQSEQAHLWMRIVRAIGALRRQRTN